MFKFAKINFLTIVLLVILTIPAVLSLFHKGFFVTDDAEWMIIRFSAFYQALHDGQFPVRFLDRLNFGYGYPVATFLYPGFMYFAVPLQVFHIGFVTSIKIVLGASMIFSGVFTYLWLRKLFDTFSSLIGSLFYVYAPYHLYDLYKRGSVGELLALAVVPFILWQIERKSLLWSAIGIAFLILSHNTLAVLFLPILLAYLIIQSKYKKNSLRNSFFMLLGGLGISAFFWVPILFELRYTVFAQTTISNWKEFYAQFPLIGASAILVLLITLLNLILKRIAIKNYRVTVLFFIVAFLSICFASSLSDIFWNILPVSFIQFPFRLLSLTILCIAFLAAVNISVLKGRAKVLSSIVLVVVLGISAFSFAKPSFYFDKEEGYYFTNDGTTTVKDEYMPVWVKEKPTQRFTSKVELVEGKGQIHNIFYRNGETSFIAEVPNESIVRVNTIYWPGWKASVDGKEVPISYNNKRGLIEITVPQGKNSVEVRFGETQLRLFADLISLVSLVLIIISYKQKKKNT